MQYSEGVPYRSATAVITADNLQCTEYRVSTTNNVVEGFICVKKGQTLEINCEAVIDTDDCQVDLIMDGILRESMTSRKKSANKKNFAFKHGIYKIKRKTWKGYIKVSDLDLSRSYGFSMENATRYLYFLFQAISIQQVPPKWAPSNYKSPEQRIFSRTPKPYQHTTKWPIGGIYHYRLVTVVLILSIRLG